jgi:hypothetical protein
VGAKHCIGWQISTVIKTEQAGPTDAGSPYYFSAMNKSLLALAALACCLAACQKSISWEEDTRAQQARLMGRYRFDSAVYNYYSVSTASIPPDNLRDSSVIRYTTQNNRGFMILTDKDQIADSMMFDVDTKIISYGFQNGLSLGESEIDLVFSWGPVNDTFPYRLTPNNGFVTKTDLPTDSLGGPLRDIEMQWEMQGNRLIFTAPIVGGFTDSIMGVAVRVRTNGNMKQYFTKL